MRGIVKSYNEKRGFGFIAPLVGRPDEVRHLFFHISAVKGGRSGVPSGAEVEFIVVRGDRGPQAADVELVELPARSVLNHESEGARLSPDGRAE